MNFFTQLSTGLLALTFSVAVLLAGCDNPAGNDDDHQEEHSEPHSVEFFMDGKTIVTYDGEVSGLFNVEEGSKTSLITAKFFDEGGDEIHGEDLGDEYSLAWEVTNTDHASIEQHEEDGRWSFHVVGTLAGETTVEFQLLHGDHPDFSTDPIEIRVE